jgi:uncharacterized protein (TIGR02145 family)
MNIIKSLLIGLTLLSFAYSTDVSISGTVTDTAGVAIAGATVKLITGGQNITTDSNGRFTLQGDNVGITVKSVVSQSYQPVVSLIKGIMKLHVQEQSSVTIQTYNLQGCLIASMHTTLGAGDHRIALTNKSSGVYLYKVQINNKDYRITSNSLCNYAISANTTQETSAYSLSKQAINNSGFKDTIVITKRGYIDCRIPVNKSDTNGITAKMHLLTVIDADGNVYHTVKIGTQIWTVENLRTTHYNDGTPIPFRETNTNDWYCWYNGDSVTYKTIYGALYGWYAVNTGKLAPVGWHVPTDAEWDTLSAYLQQNGLTGGSLKDTGTTYWRSPNMGATNSTGFSALPGGCFLSTMSNPGTFSFIGINGCWWSATVAQGQYTNTFTLCNNSIALDFDYGIYKFGACSVRLVKDNEN